jgi:DNA repair exonuclease
MMTGNNHHLLKIFFNGMEKTTFCLLLFLSFTVTASANAGHSPGSEQVLPLSQATETAGSGTFPVKPPDQLLPAVTADRKVTDRLFSGIHTIDFTLGVLPDTQAYSQSLPEIFPKMNHWFVANREALNLKYIVHLGDIVNNLDQSYQWRTASQAMRIFEQFSVPYGVIAGNHDVGDSFDYQIYSQYFGENRFRSYPWYGGSYKNNRGHYDLISAGGKKFIMIGMGWGIGNEEVDWLNRMLKQYKDRTAILYVHEYLNGESQRSIEGNLIFDKVVRPNANVRIVLSGHFYGAARREDAIDDNLDGKPDRKVMQILSDYQSLQGGQGFIRVMGFDLSHGNVYVRTFSPLNGKTHVFKKDQDNFTFSLNLDDQK